MLNKEDVEKINIWLINQLLAIPFPYGEILKEQTDTAVLTVTATSSHYCVYFQLSPRVNSFPDLLDAMPLSWQFLHEEAPVLCQLFIKEGYISRLEIIDFTLNGIRWDKIWTANPLLDYEYNMHHIRKHLTHHVLVINKILHIGRRIDLSLEVSGNRFVASFRGCHVRKLMQSSFPIKCHLCISDSKSNSFAITSDVVGIDFDCELCFIQWHKLID